MSSRRFYHDSRPIEPQKFQAQTLLWWKRCTSAPRRKCCYGIMSFTEVAEKSRTCRFIFMLGEWNISWVFCYDNRISLQHLHYFVPDPSGALSKRTSYNELEQCIEHSVRAALEMEDSRNYTGRAKNVSLAEDSKPKKIRIYKLGSILAAIALCLAGKSNTCIYLCWTRQRRHQNSMHLQTANPCYRFQTPLQRFDCLCWTMASLHQNSMHPKIAMPWCRFQNPFQKLIISAEPDEGVARTRCICRLQTLDIIDFKAPFIGWFGSSCHRDDPNHDSRPDHSLRNLQARTMGGEFFEKPIIHARGICTLVKSHVKPKSFSKVLFILMFMKTAVSEFPSLQPKASVVPTFQPTTIQAQWRRSNTWSPASYTSLNLPTRVPKKKWPQRLYIRNRLLL